MDNKSDETIVFDQDGYCNYCEEALQSMPKIYFPNEIGDKYLSQLISKLKEEGKQKKYDCLMGISGGLDSAYLAYLGYKHQLRILAVHVDDGFNTATAEDNISKIARTCGIDIVYESPDEEQYFNLVKAFIRADLPNIAIPQDNLIFAYLYKYAKKYDIHNFLSGGNFALESILQRDNTHTAYDKRHIKDISKKFSEKPINKLPFTSSFEKKIIDEIIYKINEVRPLNYINYNKAKAIKELEEFCGYNYYGGKHYESILTSFMQKYYLPRKFKVDKRTSHLSSLIVSGQMTRDNALIELNKPLYNEENIKLIIEKILNLINMTKKEFDTIMLMPPKQHNQYKTSLWRYASETKKLLRRY